MARGAEVGGREKGRRLLGVLVRGIPAARVHLGRNILILHLRLVKSMRIRRCRRLDRYRDDGVAALLPDLPFPPEQMRQICSINRLIA